MSSPAKAAALDPAELPRRIKHLMVDALHLEGLVPESISDDEPLFGEGLGLDSVDALELVVALEREFGIAIASEELGSEALANVSKLVSLVERRAARAAGEAAAPARPAGGARG